MDSLFLSSPPLIVKFPAPAAPYFSSSLLSTSSYLSPSLPKGIRSPKILVAKSSASNHLLPIRAREVTVKICLSSRTSGNGGSNSDDNAESSEEGSETEAEATEDDLGVKAALSMLRFYKCRKDSSFFFSFLNFFVELRDSSISWSLQSISAIDWFCRRDLAVASVKLPVSANLKRVLHGSLQEVRRYQGYHFDCLASLPMQSSW